MEQVSDINNISGTGIFIAPNSGFSFVKNDISTPALQQGGYIVNAEYKAIAGISVQGDIYILDPQYLLSYSSSGPYILLNLKTQVGAMAASILYKINSEYIIK